MDLRIFMRNLIEKFSDMLNVPGEGTKDIRRGKLINVMLFVMGVGLFLMSVILLIVARSNILTLEDLNFYYVGIGLGFVMVVLVALLNRFLSVKIAAVVFVLSLFLIAVFSNVPKQVVSGWGLIVFAIPIFASSFLLRPWASFISAGVSSLILIIITNYLESGIPNLPGMLNFFILATISWLSSLNQEHTIKRTQDANLNLQDSINKREHIENALRETDRRFWEMLKTLELIAVMLDEDGCITFCNDYLLNLTGWHREEILGESWFDIFIPKEIRNGLQKSVFVKTFQDGDVKAHHINDIHTRDGTASLASSAVTLVGSVHKSRRDYVGQEIMCVVYVSVTKGA